MIYLLISIGCAVAIAAVLVVGRQTTPKDHTPKRVVGDDSSVPAAEQKAPSAYDFAANSLPAKIAGQTTPPTASREQRLQLWIDQSGIDASPLALAVVSCTIGVLPAAATAFFFNGWLAALIYVGLSTIPTLFLAFKRRQRGNRLREQLPDALDLMSRMLRAGQTIPQSFRGVADEFEAPIAEEFGYCYEQQNLGLSTDIAMYEMARRTGVLELRILVVALTVHRRAGGNLSELLDNLAAVVRERYRIYGQIKALTADGRMQAAILLALPPFLLLVLSVLNKEYTTILYQFPWLLVGMFGFELFGAIWLHRIVSFDF